VARCDIGKLLPVRAHFRIESLPEADVAQLVEQPIRKLALCDFRDRIREA
jgi:hypothetical protein